MKFCLRSGPNPAYSLPDPGQTVSLGYGKGGNCLESMLELNFDLGMWSSS
jgi:hypothetical protein